MFISLYDLVIRIGFSQTPNTHENSNSSDPIIECLPCAKYGARLFHAVVIIRAVYQDSGSLSYGIL